MPFRADLHCHTTVSDGSYTPTELLYLAKEVGLSALSITDHDTVGAYEEALPLAKELGLELLPGIELSSFQNDHSVHILGYGFDLANRGLAEFCKRHVERRTERNREILKLLTQHGMPLTEEEMQGTKMQGTKMQGTKMQGIKMQSIKIPGKIIYGRPHIAQAMIAKGYISSIYEAFDRWIAEGKPCYAPGQKVSVEETIACLHQAGGKAVIAHPHLIRSNKLVNCLLEMPFDGIEGYYARMGPDQEKRWVEIGRKKGWIVTGGSDFHGAPKPHIPLGASWVTEPIFRSLFS